MVTLLMNFGDVNVITVLLLGLGYIIFSECLGNVSLISFLPYCLAVPQLRVITYFSGTTPFMIKKCGSTKFEKV